MLAALVTTAMADNVISVDQTAISQSGTAKLTINLANTGVVRGLQFTLTLPEGVTAVSSNQGITYTDGGSQSYSPGETGVLVSKTDRTENWWVLGNKVSDTEYKFVLIDPAGDGLEAGNGAVMTISFETTLTEPFTVDITGIHMAIEGSDGSSEDATQGDIEDATITEVLKGDVDGDGDITVNDATCILRHIVDKPNDKFIEAAADINGSGDVDVDDATKILQYIVGKITVLTRESSHEESSDEVDWDIYDPE